MHTAVEQLLAVIPAAGLSRRMGQPKLLLTLGGKSILERLLLALDHPSITTRTVVVRAGDIPLRQEASRLGASVVIPAADPPDMKMSVTLALDAIQRKYSPNDDDGWLLVPADHPVLDRRLIDAMINCWNTRQPRILVPRHGDRRGHPTMFRWSLAREVGRIPPESGLNWLLREFASDVMELPVDTDAALTDLDTPEDFARLQARWAAQAASD